MTLTFEWDEDKSRSNFRKHAIGFEEAKTVFNDPFAITLDDPEHSESEERYIDIGFSSKERVIVVWYTERKGNIRIIGYRKATKTESKNYENK